MAQPFFGNFRNTRAQEVTEEELAEKILAEGDLPINAATLLELKRDSERYGRRGQWLFGVAILLGCVLLTVSYFLTGAYLQDLNDAAADRKELVLILLLVRGTFFGAMSVGFLFGVFTVANAYIDQATRFRKRFYSAIMLDYAFRTFSESIKKGGKVKVGDLVVLFGAWNENVDSAFSRVRFQRKSPDLVVGGKHGIVVADTTKDEDMERNGKPPRWPKRD
jgi:hypothetical protein